MMPFGPLERHYHDVGVLNIATVREFINVIQPPSDNCVVI